MKTLLVALLLLVIGTGTAYAECAWVLWQQLVAKDYSGQFKKPYEPLEGRYATMAAYPDQRTCEAALARAIAAKPEGQEVLVCLPDTVDPRGPKGK